MNTIEEVEEKPKRKQRPKDKTRIPVATGPSSLNPGTWLTHAYENLSGADLTTEHSQHILETLVSYHPGPRYRQLWESTFFGLKDGGFELENTSTCYAEADVAAIRQQIEDSPPFTMMGTPGVLSGVHWLMFREQKRREHELEDYKPKPKRKKKAKKGATVEAPKPKLRRFSMDELEARYNAWFDDQTEERWAELWEAAHALFTRGALVTVMSAPLVPVILALAGGLGESRELAIEDWKEAMGGWLEYRREKGEAVVIPDVELVTVEVAG